MSDRTPDPLDLEPIRQRVKLAQRMFGVAFDGYPDTERAPVDIQRDRDRAALLREVDRLRVRPSGVRTEDDQTPIEATDPAPQDQESR